MRLKHDIPKSWWLAPLQAVLIAATAFAVMLALGGAHF
jgi:hypothetical protein